MKTEKDFECSEHYGKWLKKNPEALAERKKEVSIVNKGIKHIISSIKCKTCGSIKEHPITGYCFICDTDNY